MSKKSIPKLKLIIGIAKNHFGSVTYHMGYPLDSGNPNILWLGSRGLSVPVGDDRSIRRWVHGDCLLHKAVEEFSPAA